MKIRLANRHDAAQLVDIYKPYVEETAITFEYQVPSLEEFQQRIEKTLQANYPYLVLEEEGVILGYAYGSAYYGRSAYDWSVELSIYLNQNNRGTGLGTILYDYLEELLEKQGYRRFVACIAYPNEASVKFHEKRGYEQVAHFKEIGYKFERWHDIVWFEKRIALPVSPLKTLEEIGEKNEKEICS